MLALLALSGCGKDESKEANTTTCSTPPPSIAAPASLATFPKPDAVVYTTASAAGPSTIVEGYAPGDITSVYDAYGEALAKPPYGITKKEHDAHDAEVAFSGNATTGQVRLGEACKDRVSVKVTLRPA
jgi:hypothetical protein